MSIEFLNHVIGTKGLLHTLERSAQVIMRYSFGRARFAEMMEYLDLGLGSMGVKVTFCVTASLLESHYGFLRRFSDLGHEFAAHGYFHTNMKMKPLAEQCELVERSFCAFEKLKLRVRGFRCPYLSYNEDTMAALNRSPFTWTSNDVILYDETVKPRRRPDMHLRMLGALYATSSPDVSISVPARMGGLVDIPITAPDDEMLFERYRIKERGAISAVWNAIFRKVYTRGELFHLLFHPERFRYFEASIRELAAAAKGMAPGVWFATLNEITAWWEERQAAAWTLEKIKNGVRIRLKAPPHSTVLIKSAERGRGEGLLCGLYASAGTVNRSGYFVFDAGDGSIHTVQLSKRCSPEVKRFLAGEGFIVSVVDYPHRNSLFIDGYESFSPRDRRVLLDIIDNSSYPLLRLWRWPHGAQSAFTVSSDVDSINVTDFFKRFINF